MKRNSISVIKQSESEIEFSFVAGKELEAADYLIKAVDGNSELSLTNDEDEESEGSTSIKYENGSFWFRNGGHGWTGEWNVVSQEDLKALIFRLAPHNDGSHWSLVGRLRKC